MAGLCKLVCGLCPCGEFGFQTKVTHGKTGTNKVFTHIPNCAGDMQKPKMLEQGNAVWLIHDDNKITFKEGLELYEAVAASLRGETGHNLPIGSSVGIIMNNRPEWMLTFLASISAGLRAVPLNSFLKTEELEYVIKDADIKVLFCDIQRMEKVLPFAPSMTMKLVLVDEDQAKADSAGAKLWSQVVADGRGKPPPSTERVKQSDDCMIMYTSGSTGFPKGVAHSNLSLGTCTKLTHIAQCVEPAAPGDKMLMNLPLFHITGLAGCLLLSIAAGTTIVTLQKWNGSKALELIEKHKITRMLGVPTQVQDLFEAPDFDPKRIASIRSFITGGAPIAPSLFEKMNKIVPKAKGMQGYGLTETCGGVAVNRDGKHFDSVGKAVPLIATIVIKDPQGKILKDGERGEICIKSAMVMSRYHNRPEDTAKVIDDEGYFHSGDVGEIHDGYVFIKDRLKDIIIRAGENIDCSEVEAAVLAHPKIRECSVFGLPDHRLGEVVGCAIFRKAVPPPAVDITAQEVSDFVKAKLASFKVPQPEHIFFHEEQLPRGDTGKPDKKGMRKRWTEYMEQQQKAA